MPETPVQQIQRRVDEAIAKGALPAADRQATIEFLSKDQARADFFARELAGGSYFGKKAQEEAALRKTHEEQMVREREALAREKQSLEVWSRDARVELDRARQIQAEHDRLLAENGSLRQVTRDYNLEGEVQLPTRAVAAQAPTIQPDAQGRLRDVSTGKFISEERATQAFQELIGLTSKALTIQAQHQQLFGQPLTDSLIEEALAAGQPDLNAYWEAKYNVPAKRAELGEQVRQAEVSKIREEERAKLLGEMAVDPSRFAGGAGNYTPEPSLLANTYMHSRAAEANPFTGADGKTPLLPEQRSHVAAKRASLDAANTMWQRHFNPDGTPRSGVKPPQSYTDNLAYQDS